MISPRKASSALNLIPEEVEEKMNPTTSKSCESLYSNSSTGSASLIYQRKSNTGLINKPDGRRGIRQPAIIPATNEVRQRVLSARRLRMKTFQNQLADAQQTIAELAHENRILRTLHKRQDSALSKYESNNAELPQLLHSHAEEIRMWQTKYRNLQTINKELEQKLKQKEAVILSLSDQNKHFIQLNKDKNLEDRQRLTEKLQTLELRLQEKDNDIKMIARKMQLEAKQSKQQLQVEQKRNREILMKLEKARLELSGYRKLDEMQQQEKCNAQTRRSNRSSNNDSSKGEKEINTYTLGNGTESETADEIEALNSQRSSHSSSNMVQRTARSIKNSTNEEHLALTSSSSGLIQQVTKHQQPPPNKSMAVLRRIDQVALIQRQNSNLSSMTQSLQEKLEYDYDVDKEHDDADELDEAHECEENTADNLYDDINADGDYVSNIDGIDNAGLVNANANYYYKETQKTENHNPGKKTRMKEEISSLRKHISNDYKEREAFLDTFCRQATNGVLRDETPKNRNSNERERNIPGNRKNKLLAALKAIDDNKSED